VISSHIGWILPDLRGINQASGRGNLMGFHKGKGTRRLRNIFDKKELQLGFMSLSDPDLSVRPALRFVPNFWF